VNVNLNSGMRRNALRGLVTGRGPDAGRQVGHLKFRSLSPLAEAMVQVAESGGLPVPDAGIMAGTDGVYFLVGWSSVVGSDVL
jgi:hypothetical protein